MVSGPAMPGSLPRTTPMPGGTSSGREFWLGCKLHVTETCDDPPPCTCGPASAAGQAAAGSSGEGAQDRGHDKGCAHLVFPNLITHVATTDATVTGNQMTTAICEDLTRQNLAPGRSYLDSGYLSAAVVVSALTTRAAPGSLEGRPLGEQGLMASREQHPEGPSWASPGGHVQAGQLAPDGGDGRGGPTSSGTPCDRPPEADVDCRHLPGLSGAFVSRGAGLSAVWWLTGLQGAGAWRRRGHRWLVPAQGVAEEQAPPDGSAREAGSGRCGDLRQGRGGIPDRHDRLAGCGSLSLAGGSGVSDQAHDRVDCGRDEAGRQVWQRTHAGEADHEQAAAGGQEPGDAGQGVPEVEMVQHGHHRDQVSLAVASRYGELPEAAVAYGHPRVMGQARARGACHARIGVDPGDAREVRGQLPGEHARPAADVYGGPAAGWQVPQDPAVVVLVVIPRVARVDPVQPSPGTGQHRIRAVPDIHARQSPRGCGNPPPPPAHATPCGFRPAAGQPAAGGQNDQFSTARKRSRMTNGPTRKYRRIPSDCRDQRS